MKRVISLVYKQKYLFSGMLAKIPALAPPPSWVPNEHVKKLKS